MVKTISVRKLRINLADVLKNVRNHFDRYIISRRGEPSAVLMCVDDYEGWLETLEIMASNKAMDDIKIAREEIKKGKFYKFEEVFGNRKRPKKK